MLLESDQAILQFMLDSIVQMGRAYGLELKWDNTETMKVRHAGVIMNPVGLPREQKESAVYLGGLLCADGSPSAEVFRRLGASWAAFLALERVWEHANISRHRKREILQALMIPKLMYGLEGLWLRKADRARLDSFQV